MRIHCISTGLVTVHPSQQTGNGKGIFKMLNILRDKEWSAWLPIHVWVIEHPEGVVVIDTGETSRSLEPGYFPSWHPYFKNFKTRVNSEEEIGPQLKKIGIDPLDVKYVIMTHLHTDHAGGLRHFPDSEILVHSPAYKNALGIKGLLKGFLNNRFPSWFSPKLFSLDNNSFGPFPQSLKLFDDLIIVPTYGHTSYHISVILKQEDIFYFFAGDASYTQVNMIEGKIDGVSMHDKIALDTLNNIKEFASNYPTIYLPSHDVDSEKRFNDQELVFNMEQVEAG